MGGFCLLTCDDPLRGRLIAYFMAREVSTDPASAHRVLRLKATGDSVYDRWTHHWTMGLWL